MIVMPLFQTAQPTGIFGAGTVGLALANAWESPLELVGGFTVSIFMEIFYG